MSKRYKRSTGTGILRGGLSLGEPPTQPVFDGTRSERGAYRRMLWLLWYRCPWTDFEDKDLNAKRCDDWSSDPDLFMVLVCGVNDARETHKILDIDVKRYLTMYAWLCEDLPQGRDHLTWIEAWRYLERGIERRKEHTYNVAKKATGFSYRTPATPAQAAALYREHIAIQRGPRPRMLDIVETTPGHTFSYQDMEHLPPRKPHDHHPRDKMDHENYALVRSRVSRTHIGYIEPNADKEWQESKDALTAKRKMLEAKRGNTDTRVKQRACSYSTLDEFIRKYRKEKA